MTMALPNEKVNCVLWLAKLKSAVIQRKFRIQYKKEALHRNSISNQIKKFKETGSVNDKSQSGTSYVSEESVQILWDKISYESV